MAEEITPHLHFQYADASHQAETAVSGMWLFLATEVLFFGGLVLTWMVSRHWQQAGFDAGGRETVLWIGTTNLVVLVTSSFVYSAGLSFIRLNQPRRLIQCCAGTVALGIIFLILKIYEWHIDLSEHLFPTGPFKLHGDEANGARLFWSFYFIATALHAAHLSIGVGLVGWVIMRARKGAYSAIWHTPVEVIGLYWSFVDVVWIVLYPMIYLIGRGA
ncbi:MAG TPA: cytochrome c oxidase subunit 3 [Acetobacteraceae bacterium]|jgi:cytochrome c oxidase subunit III|nr:cytochrome c oxidase subunit 3 [Acetobacteraceae bacterium]